MKLTAILLTMLLALTSRPLTAGDLSPAALTQATAIRCGNLTYAGSKSSTCFADKFLSTANEESSLQVLPNFVSVRLDSDELFNSPFNVISGEGSFSFTEKDRANLTRYLTCGGFLLASPGCSDQEWDRSFRNEMKAILPEAKLVRIPMTHPVFSTVYQIPTLTLKGGGTTLVEGVELNGRLVMIYSTEGLNDAKHAKGCCCCGGDMILQSEQVNVNILMYALLH
jgi:hypothetical protein